MSIYLKKIVISLTLISFSGTAIAQCATPYIHTWRWWSNLAYPEDLTTGWGTYPETYSYIIDNKMGTYVDTNLDVGQGPNGEGKVRFLNIDSGPTGPDAWTRVWSGSLECTYLIPNTNNHWADNQICIPPHYPADSARISLNPAQMGSQSLGLNTLIILHEVGHVFSLGHMPPICTTTFMIEEPYVGQSEQLNSSEIIWINSTY